jgi:NTP pyrophosphatase (non-canonical NTP hydrolase)
MLREFFPSTNEGATIYEGFLQNTNCFCKIFDIKTSISETINDISDFLVKNGYDEVKLEMFDDNNTYKESPVTIAHHGYQEQLVLFIERDVIAQTQTKFLINELKKFRNDRDWEQFHNPKDLAIALSIEANELLEQFLWKRPEDACIEKIKEELADVFAFALLFADKVDLDIEEITLNKIKQNALKYPIEKSKGTSKKYNEL